MKMEQNAERPNEGVSITTGFILNMGIAFIAISIMLLTMQGPMEEITESTRETQIRVTGEAIVADFERADRLVRSLDDPDIEVEIEQPNVEYSVNVSSDELHMMTDNLNVTVEYGGEKALDPDSDFSSSADASITYDDSADELVVE